jgi:AraC-like DNA-binding protein
MKQIQRLSLGDISINFAKVIFDTLTDMGFETQNLSESFSFNDEFLTTPDTRISIPKYMRLGHQAILMTGRPDLGLVFGSKTHNGAAGLAALAAQCAPDLESALRLLINMETLSSQNSRGKSRFYIEDGRAVCHFYSISPYNRYNLFVVDAMLSTWWRFCKKHTEDKVHCHHIEIEYPKPSHADSFETHFGCPILFSQKRNALVLKRGHHHERLTDSCATTFSKMTEICEQERRKWNSGTSTADQVVDLISANLTGTPPNIESIARKLGIAGWTLRRRLANEGFKFQTLLDDTRNALAQTYVRDTKHNFTEIAFLLGFSSPSAFHRAFKRWSGMSPGSYRDGPKHDQTK